MSEAEQYAAEAAEAEADAAWAGADDPGHTVGGTAHPKSFIVAPALEPEPEAEAG